MKTKRRLIRFCSPASGVDETSVAYLKLQCDAKLRAKRRSISLNYSVTSGKNRTFFD